MRLPIVSLLTLIALAACGEPAPGVARVCLSRFAVTPVADLRDVDGMRFTLDGPLPEGVIFDDARAELEVVATLGGGVSASGRPFFDRWLLQPADAPGEVAYSTRVEQWFDGRDDASCLGPDAPNDAYVVPSLGSPDHLVVPLRSDVPGTSFEPAFATPALLERFEGDDPCLSSGGLPLAVLVSFADGTGSEVPLCLHLTPMPRRF